MTISDCSLQCREREIVQQLETKEESALEIRETYSSLQEEVDLKTKKLNKVHVLNTEMHKSQQHRVTNISVFVVWCPIEFTSAMIFTWYVCCFQNK